MYYKEDQHVVEAIAASLKKEMLGEMRKGGLIELVDEPRIIANLLAVSDVSIDITAQFLQWMVDEYVALLVMRALPQYQSLFDAMVQRGAVSPESRIEHGNGQYFYAFERREDKENGAISRVIVLQTQNENFLFVMCGRRPLGHLHIRQFWPDIRDVLNEASGNFEGSLSEIANRNDLSLKDLAKLGATLNRVSDDFDGNEYGCVRPSLRFFTSGSLIPRKDSAGDGLHYGDFRDRGYVLSALGTSKGETLNVQRMLDKGYGPLRRAMTAMSYAVAALTPREG